MVKMIGGKQFEILQEISVLQFFLGELETRLVVIDDLRQNLFNVIGDWIGCDFVVAVKKGNWSPVF